MWQQRLRAQELRQAKSKAEMLETEAQLAKWDLELRRKQRDMQERVTQGGKRSHVQHLSAEERRAIVRAHVLGDVDISSVLTRFARNREDAPTVSVDVDVSVVIEGEALRGERGF
jgi:hypothetical protein